MSQSLIYFCYSSKVLAGFDCQGRTKFLPIIFRKTFRSNYLPNPVWRSGSVVRNQWDSAMIYRASAQKFPCKGFQLKWVTKEICVKCFDLSVLTSLWVEGHREKANLRWLPGLHLDNYSCKMLQFEVTWVHQPLIKTRIQHASQTIVS